MCPCPAIVLFLDPGVSTVPVGSCRILVLSSTLLRTPPSWSFCWPAGTVITYNALLSACEKAGQWQQALHLGVFLAISIYRYLQIFWSLASSNHGNGVPSQLESSIHRELMGIVHCHVWLPEGSWPPRVSWRLRPSTDEPNDWWFFKIVVHPSRLQDDLWFMDIYMVYPCCIPMDTPNWSMLKIIIKFAFRKFLGRHPLFEITHAHPTSCWCLPQGKLT